MQISQQTLVSQSVSQSVKVRMPGQGPRTPTTLARQQLKGVDEVSCEMCGGLTCGGVEQLVAFHTNCCHITAVQWYRDGYMTCQDSRSHLGRVFPTIKCCDADVCQYSRLQRAPGWTHVNAAPCAALVTWSLDDEDVMAVRSASLGSRLWTLSACFVRVAGQLLVFDEKLPPWRNRSARRARIPGAGVLGSAELPRLVDAPREGFCNPVSGRRRSPNAMTARWCADCQGVSRI